MRLIRDWVGAIILGLDRMFSPRAMKRDPEHQAKVDAETANLILYQFLACPFCVKVRRMIRRLGLKIETRDVLENPTFEKELLEGGKEYQVPCLRIAHPDGRIEWLYESGAIIAYLKERFAK